MRTAILVILVGCAAESPPQMSEAVAISTTLPAATDVCALAAELPADNLCSLMCDPDAMKAAMRAAGEADGRCYDFVCSLPGGTNAYVGVCLVHESIGHLSPIEITSAR